MNRATRVFAVSLNEWRVLRKYQEVLILLVVIPLVMIVLMSKGLLAVVREFDPQDGALSGADHAVPGFTLMFGFLIIGFLGNSFMNEHSWGTWERLRASSARPSEILVGKILPYAVISILQFVLTLSIGWLVLGMHIRGSLVALALLLTAIVAFIMATSLFFAAFCSSGQQISAFANLVGIVLGLFGGVFLPVQALPAWVQFVSPVTPQYWAMRGFEQVLTNNGGLASISLELLILFVGATVLFGLALRRFRFDERKQNMV